MSLILEALKKSESRRRLGEAPDLGTPFTVARRRRSPLPLIVIVVAVAAGLGWWYLRTLPPKLAPNTIVSLPPAPAPPPASRNPANGPQGTPPAARTPPPAQAREPVTATARDSTAAPTPAKPDAPAAAMTAKAAARADGNTSNPAAGKTSDLQAMRAMNRHLPATAASAASPNPNPAAVPPAAAPPPTTTRAAMPVPAPAPASAPPATMPVAKTDSNAASPVNPPKPASPDATTVKPGDATALPQYYELAYGVRKDIPPFALSMHVFAADAASRFVVVDGERKTEGDSVKEGLTLREIRPDGMVLEFRGQRFFYPRPGR